MGRPVAHRHRGRFTEEVTFGNGYRLHHQMGIIRQVVERRPPNLLVVLTPRHLLLKLVGI
jgi:hypothetical protein